MLVSSVPVFAFYHVCTFSLGLLCFVMFVVFVVLAVFAAAAAAAAPKPVFPYVMTMP